MAMNLARARTRMSDDTREAPPPRVGFSAASPRMFHRSPAGGFSSSPGRGPAIITRNNPGKPLNLIKLT